MTEITTGNLIYIHRYNAYSISSSHTIDTVRDAIAFIKKKTGNCELSAVFDIVRRGVIVSLPDNPDSIQTVTEVNMLTALLADTDDPMIPDRTSGHVISIDEYGRATVFAFDTADTLQAVPLRVLVDKYFA